MSSEASSFTEEVATTMLKELQSWWEIPSMAQYISLFRESFNLPEIEIEELENALIDDTLKGPSEWLQTLIVAFLKSIMPGRVNATNWEDQLRKLVRRKWSESPFADKENPFVEDLSFHQVNLRSKVEIIYCFCLYRLDRNDIGDVMKSMDADALRVQKLGSDEAGNTYWYFYGTRLYKEEVLEEKKTWDEEWKEQKRKSVNKKRGRGRPRKKPRRSDGESDGDDLHNTSKNDFMNVSEKSRWSVVCDTIEEWVNFAEKFKTSKSKTEKALFTIIQENFLPTLNKIYEEKERKLQQKIRELMPALPVREKIVTRRETRRMRGEDVSYSYNGYYSDEEVQTPVIKDRAQRLEERRRRATEAESIQIISHKKSKREIPVVEMDNSSSSDRSDSSGPDLQSQMEKLLTSIKLHKDAWPFLYPVSEDDAPGYYAIVKDPIDLSIIENRLFNGEYDTIGDLDADISQVVSNCELYNGENHPYTKMAQSLKKMYERELAKILENFESAESGSSAGSEEGSDSRSHSSSNSSSPTHESSVVDPKEHKRKNGNKKKKRSMEALDLLAQASDIAVQDGFASGDSPPQKKSPIPQDNRPALYNVPSTSIPCNPASSSSQSTNKTSPPATIPRFAPANNSPGSKKNKSVVSTKVSDLVKQNSHVENISSTSVNTIPSKNGGNVVHQNNVYASYNPKTVPVVISGYNSVSSNQQDLGIKSNSVPAVTMQSNVCMPNGLPIVQQVMLPAGTQQIQIPSNGQFVFASPQNTVRLFNKDQNVQMQNNVGQLSQGFTKVVPQIVASAPMMQMSKEGVQGLQFHTLSQSNTQAQFNQVTQSPQFVNIPYMVTNQNNSSQQSVVNFQPYPLSPRQMQINSQGNV